jgi:release factor glutamine methyltransferase
VSPRPEPPTALFLLREAARTLAGAGIPEAGKEAEILLTHVLSIDRVTLYRDDPPVAPESQKRLHVLLERRGRREPLQYVMGYVDFLGLAIAVGPGVLIPRPETELLVHEFLTHAGKGRVLRVLDLCTGSGAVALALGRELPGARLYGTDISAEALRYARRSAKANGIGNVQFRRGHLFEPVGGLLFDGIVGNPPYVESGVIAALEPEVRDWEPREALDGGPDGLRFYREILGAAPLHMSPGGILALEVGLHQAPRVQNMAEGAGLRLVHTVVDCTGVKRVVLFRLPKHP